MVEWNERKKLYPPWSSPFPNPSSRVIFEGEVTLSDVWLNSEIIELIQLWSGIYSRKIQLKSDHWLCKAWKSQETISGSDNYHDNPQFYPGVYVAVIILLTYPVSTCTAERSFSSMKRLKTLLWSTMTDGRLSSLAILHRLVLKVDILPFACKPPPCLTLFYPFLL